MNRGKVLSGRVNEDGTGAKSKATALKLYQEDQMVRCYTTQLVRPAGPTYGLRCYKIENKNKKSRTSIRKAPPS